MLPGAGRRHHSAAPDGGGTDGLEEVLDDERGKTEGQLVGQQEPAGVRGPSPTRAAPVPR